MSQHLRIVRSLIAFALGAVALATPRAAHADFPPYAKVVGIAVLAPLSGPDKQLGWDLSAGVQAAVDDANTARGLTDFGWVMKSYDDQGDPGIAEQQAQFALVDPSTSFIIGHLGGQETLLALHVYHEQDVPLIIPTSPLSSLTRQGYDDVFRICPPDTLEGLLDARYVERNLKPAKIAVVWEENDYGGNTATSFVAYFSNGAKTKTVDYSVDVDLKKLKDVVAKVQADPADLLYITGRGGPMAKVLLALRAAGVNTPALGTSDFYSDALDKHLGAAGDGMLVSTCVPPVQFMPSAQSFQHRFEAQHGRLSAFALYGYVAAQVAISAALQTRSADKHMLNRQLATGIFPTVIGNISFRPGGDPADPNMYFYRIDSGSLKYVGSALPNPAVLR